jgi:hypothetical protein
MESIAIGSISLLFLFIVLGIWFLPFVIILFSNRTSGREKLAWILAVIFISWFAWIFYLLLAPLRSRE